MEEVQKSQLPPDLFQVPSVFKCRFCSVSKVLLYEFVFHSLTSVLQQRAVNQTCVCCDLCHILGFQCCFNLNLFILVILYVKINLVTLLFETKKVWSVCQHSPREANELKRSGVLLHSVVIWWKDGHGFCCTVMNNWHCAYIYPII